MKCPSCGRGLSAKYRQGQHERRIPRRLTRYGMKPAPRQCSWSPA